MFFRLLDAVYFYHGTLCRRLSFIQKKIMATAERSITGSAGTKMHLCVCALRFKACIGAVFRPIECFPNYNKH